MISAHLRRASRRAQTRGSETEQDRLEVDQHVAFGDQLDFSGDRTEHHIDVIAYILVVIPTVDDGLATDVALDARRLELLDQLGVRIVLQIEGRELISRISSSGANTRDGGAAPKHT